MKSKIFFLVAILASLAVFSWYQNNSVETTLPLPPKELKAISEVGIFVQSESPESFGDIQSEAYSFGYRRGRDAFLIQNNHPDAPTSTTQQQYAVLIEEASLTEEEKKNYEEAMSKGYVDGYHKASDMIHCPRNCYYR